MPVTTLVLRAMQETGITRYTPYVLVATAVFAFMHVADELSGNWDAGAPGQALGDPTTASVMVGAMILVGMWALWWILTDRSWGYVLALLFGLQFLLTGGMHFIDTADMTTFRWAVVVLEVASALVLVVLSANGLVTSKPWRRQDAAGA